MFASNIFSSLTMAVRRLHRDYNELLENPIEGVLAHPTDENILEWHFAIAGAADTPFEGGLYHGELIFSTDYPMKAPAVYFITPNGRFQCNKDLCLSFGTTPSKLWSPANTTLSILCELLHSFNDTKNYAFTNSEVRPVESQRQLAEKSWAYNLNDRTFCTYFPNLVNVISEKSDENGNLFTKPVLTKDKII